MAETTPSPTHPLPVIRIRPVSAGALTRMREVFEFGELLVFLAWRDVVVRYKQTFLGVVWVILQPLLTMAVFATIFGSLAKLPSDGQPYPVFVLCGLVPWQLFSYALNAAAGSLVANERLVSKVYFPRLIIPIASILAGLVDFGIALGLLIGAMIWYGVPLGGLAALLPLFVVVAVLAATAVGVGLSALNVRYRDVRYALPFLSQLWLFATPVAYPATLIPAPWRTLYGLNPMVGVVESFRWVLLGTPAPAPGMLMASCVVVFLILAASLTYFARVERSFADVI